MRNALILSLLISAATGGALADGVQDICEESGGGDESCACARAAIDDAFSTEGVAVYEAVVRHYLGSATPANPEGSWDVAFERGARELGMHRNEAAVKANEIGRAHQTAIRICGLKPAPAEGEAAPESAETPAESGEAPAEGVETVAPEAVQQQ